MMWLKRLIRWIKTQWTDWRFRASLPYVSVEDRNEAWLAFVSFTHKWIEGWEQKHIVVKELEFPIILPNGRHELLPSGFPKMEKRMVEVEEPVPQPDRVELMRELGVGKHPRSILIRAYEERSLQKMVSDALKSHEVYGQRKENWIQFVDQVAATMLQISHAGFPDLAGTYDFTQRWKGTIK